MPLGGHVECGRVSARQTPVSSVKPRYAVQISRVRWHGGVAFPMERKSIVCAPL